MRNTVDMRAVEDREVGVMPFTGERYTPETEGNIHLEHVHRYLMVRDLVVGKDVLDIASGEGFGSFKLADVARKVVGVDIDPTSVKHANRRYGLPNLSFVQGSCSSIPLEDKSVDVVVSFETIEHHDEHDQMMQEVCRVLRPNGILIISSPDKREYTDIPQTQNPHHVKELYREELQNLLALYFVNLVIYGQRVVFGSAMFLEERKGLTKTTDALSLEETMGLARPIYLIAVASNGDLPDLPPSSLLEDDVLNSELVDVQLRQLSAERDNFQSTSEYYKEKFEVLRTLSEIREARAARSFGKKIERRAKLIAKHLNSFFAQLRGAVRRNTQVSGGISNADHAGSSEIHPIKLLFPLGHFYSPVADPRDIQSRRKHIFRPRTSSLGIDYQIDKQLSLLGALKPYVSQVDYPETDPGDGITYFYRNDQYPAQDADFLFAILCHFRPANMIEVGSGFSSLITADVNRRVLNGALNFTCVEPFPRQFLIDGVAGVSNLVVSKVEDLEPSFFDQLKRGDILFIDSSHVSKVGSDVNYLLFEVIPRLQSGVIVHFHDIFLPDEYPEQWVINDNRNWNEQYLLQAFLQYNSDWEVLWSAHLMGVQQTQAVDKVFTRASRLGRGGSFWIQRR